MQRSEELLRIDAIHVTHIAFQVHGRVPDHGHVGVQAVNVIGEFAEIAGQTPGAKFRPLLHHRVVQLGKPDGWLVDAVRRRDDRRERREAEPKPGGCRVGVALLQEFLKLRPAKLTPAGVRLAPPLHLVEVNRIQLDVLDSDLQDLPDERTISGVVPAGHVAEGLLGRVINRCSEFILLAPVPGVRLLGEQRLVHQRGPHITSHPDVILVCQFDEAARHRGVLSLGMQAGSLMEIHNGEIYAQFVKLADCGFAPLLIPLLDGVDGFTAAAQDEGKRLHVGGGDDTVMRPVGAGGIRGRRNRGTPRVAADESKYEQQKTARGSERTPGPLRQARLRTDQN